MKLLAWLTVLLPFWLSSAHAQSPLMPQASETLDPTEASAPSPNDVRELSRLLSDPSIIAWLKERAEGDTADDGEPAGGGLHDIIRDNLAVIADRMKAVGTALAALPKTPEIVSGTWNKNVTPNQRLALINLILIFLFTGIGLEWLYWRYAVRPKRWAEVRHDTELATKTLAILARAGLIVAGMLVFTLGLLGSFAALDWQPQVRTMVSEWLFLIVALRAAVGFAEIFYAPHDERLRLTPLKTRSARMMTIGLIGVTLVLAGSSTLSTTTQLLGAGPEAGLGIEIVGAMLTTLVASALFWVIHIRTEKALKHRSIVFSVLATVLFAATFLTWLIGMHRLSASIFTIAVLTYFASVLRYGIHSAFALAGVDDPDDVESRENRIGIYQPVAVRLGRFGVISLGLFTLAWIWSLGPWATDQNSDLGEFMSVAMDVFVAWLIADLVWTLTRTAIDRKMSAMPKLEHGVTPGPEARMATLLPLFKKVVLVTVIGMVALITLSSLGINIAPILAGAGVVGLAIGFGAQALVRDIVSGVFFLIDDAFRVGEYIEMGELRGTVESISVRSLRVRHHRGAVHTIPFGELKSLTNYSRDWVMMKLEFRVPFDTDLKLAKKIVKKIDAELQANPDYGQNFIQPLKFQGVRRMEEFNMVVGVKFMTKPGEQWTIRRDAYQRIRDEFEKAGINFAQRNVKVEVIGKGEITDEVREQAVGAAQDAIEQQAGVPAG